MWSSREEDSGDPGKCIASRENRFAVPDVIADPATYIGRTRIENVVQGIESHSQTGGPGHSLCGGQHLRGIEDEQSLGEVPGTEDADSQKKAPECWRQSLQTLPESLLFDCA